MAFAFARDGGLPFSAWVRHVSPTHRTPVYAIWLVAMAAVLFTIYTPVYVTITVVCTIFLYISYVLPIALGFVAYGRSWARLGPWQLGRWYRPFALLAVVACLGLIVIGFQPPNEIAVYVVGFVTLGLIAMWLLIARRNFAGPPHGVLSQHRLDEIHAAEEMVHQAPVGD
jgi:amino acid transporter